MTIPPPKWITPFFFFAVIAALAAVVLVLLLHDINKPEIGGKTIADITINLGGQPVREHCTTCHTNGSRSDSVIIGKTIPLHPNIKPHRIDQLGCTGCHLGEGMALDLEISHGLPGLSARKVLGGKDLQASCFRCHHPGPLPGAEKAWGGYKLFFANACNTCHAISDVNRRGFYGPDLSRVGSILGLDQIQEAIREPRKKPANSSMPRLPLSKSQSREISYFLKSLTGDQFYATPMQMRSGLVMTAEVDLRPQDKDLTYGEKLLYQKQCLACHKFGEVDGRVGPDLSYIGAQRDAGYLKTFLNNSTQLIPGSVMPRILMDSAVEKTLIQFLSIQAIEPISSIKPVLGESGRIKGSEALITGGKHLYIQFCQRCHAANGDGHGPIQPNLASFPRAFTGNVDFFLSVSDQRLQNSLRKGVPGTSMPGYGKLISEKQIEQLLDLIFTSFINVARHKKNASSVLPEAPEPLVMQQNSNELYAENCQRCHGAFGSGKGSEYLKHLPRPRNLRNQQYFKAISDIRIAHAIYDGIPGTAMPAFKDHLDNRDLWTLVGKVKGFSHTQD